MPYISSRPYPPREDPRILREGLRSPVRVVENCGVSQPVGGVSRGRDGDCRYLPWRHDLIALPRNSEDGEKAC